MRKGTNPNPPSDDTEAAVKDALKLFEPFQKGLEGYEPLEPKVTIHIPEEVAMPGPPAREDADEPFVYLFAVLVVGWLGVCAVLFWSIIHEYIYIYIKGASSRKA